MILYDLYADDGRMHWLPLSLLNEREPHQNISHRRLPKWDDHVAFIESRPYRYWYWFTEVAKPNAPPPLRFPARPAGCVYLTRQREIGIGVLKAFRGQGLARAAVTELMLRHPGRFLANINPVNEASIALFRKLGFGGPIQITLEKPCDR